MKIKRFITVFIKSPLVPLLSQTNPIHIVTPCFSNSHFNILPSISTSPKLCAYIYRLPDAYFTSQPYHYFLFGHTNGLKNSTDIRTVWTRCICRNACKLSSYLQLQEVETLTLRQPNLTTVIFSTCRHPASGQFSRSPKSAPGRVLKSRKVN